MIRFGSFTPVALLAAIAREADPLNVPIGVARPSISGRDASPRQGNVAAGRHSVRTYPRDSREGTSVDS